MNVRALCLLLFLVTAATASGTEVMLGPVEPVSDTAVLKPDQFGTLDLAAGDGSFGALLIHDREIWFSTMTSDGGSLRSTHLMTVGSPFWLPHAEGTTVWTGERYVAFWNVNGELYSATITLDGKVSEISHIATGLERWGAPVAAWNPSIGSGLLLWPSAGASFAEDGTLLERFVIDSDPISVMPFGQSFVGVTEQVSDAHYSQLSVTAFGPSGETNRLRQFGEQVQIVIAVCGDEILVLERGTVSGHSALNVHRLDEEGGVLSFFTLAETPGAVPYPTEILGCDDAGFTMLTYAPVAIERIAGSERVERNEWELGFAQDAARSGDTILLAGGGKAFLRHDDHPAELIDIPLLLSADRQIPLEGIRTDHGEVFLMSGLDGHYLLLTDGNEERMVRLPQFRESAMSLSSDGTKVLVVWNEPRERGHIGLRGMILYLPELRAEAPFEISAMDDRSPSAAPSGDGFLVVWSRQLYQDFSTTRSGIFGRQVPSPSGVEPEQQIFGVEEDGYGTPLLREWNDGFLLLSSRGTPCWRTLCAGQTPFALEATSLTTDLQRLWTVTVDNSPEHNEFPADAECAGEKCFIVWERAEKISDRCIVLSEEHSVGVGLIHEQGSVSARGIVDLPDLNDYDPSIARIENHWLLAWTTAGVAGCTAGDDSDVHAALFSPHGLPLTGEHDSIAVASTRYQEGHPVVIPGDPAHIYFSQVTPEAGTGAAERLQRRSVEIDRGRRRSVSRR